MEKQHSEYNPQEPYGNTTSGISIIVNNNQNIEDANNNNVKH